MKDLADRIEAAIKPSPMCRDCADFGPRCPNSGELCDSKESAKELSDMVRKLVSISAIEELIEGYQFRFGDSLNSKGVRDDLQTLIDENKSD